MSSWDLFSYIYWVLREVPLCLGDTLPKSWDHRKELWVQLRTIRKNCWSNSAGVVGLIPKKDPVFPSLFHRLTLMTDVVDPSLSTVLSHRSGIPCDRNRPNAELHVTWLRDGFPWREVCVSAVLEEILQKKKKKKAIGLETTHGKWHQGITDWPKWSGKCLPNPPTGCSQPRTTGALKTQKMY